MQAFYKGLGTPARLDGDTLRLEGLAAHRGRFVGLDATDPALIEKAKANLPEWADGTLPRELVDFGMVSRNTRYFPFGETPGVTCADPSVQVSLWRLADRVLLAVYNTDESVKKDIVLNLDLDALHLTPKLEWQEFVGVRWFFAADKAPTPSLDFYSQTLSLKAMPPKKGRLVAIRKY